MKAVCYALCLICLAAGCLMALGLLGGTTYIVAAAFAAAFFYVLAPLVD